MLLPLSGIVERCKATRVAPRIVAKVGYVMEQGTKKNNRGYVIPDKGKGRLDVDGKDIFLASHWADDSKLRIEFKEEKGKGEGFLTPNEYKREDRHPDWRGRFTSSTGKVWLVAAWNRDRNGDTLFSVSLTDPDTRPHRSDTASTQASASTPASAGVPPHQAPSPPPASAASASSPASPSSAPAHAPAAPPPTPPASATPTAPAPATPGQSVGQPEEYVIEFGDIFGGGQG